MLIGCCMRHDLSPEMQQKQREWYILSHNYQKLYFKSRKSCVGDGILYNDGKLQILHDKKKYCLLKIIFFCSVC